MRVIGVLAAVLLNGIFCAVAGLAAASEAVVPIGRVLAAATAAALAATIVLLVVAEFRRASNVPPRAMLVLCVLVPALWLAGALDADGVSGAEGVLLAVVSLLALGTWFVFRASLGRRVA